jgi:hypothetical protein
LTTLTVLSFGQVFHPSIGICVIFFPWLDWMMGLGEEEHRSKILQSCHSKGRHCQHDISLVTLTLTEVVFVWFSHHKVCLFMFFPYCSLWKEVTICSLHPRRRRRICM